MAMGLALQPSSFDSFAICHSQTSLALALSCSKVALIDISVLRLENSFAIRASIDEVTFILASVWVNDFPLSVFHVVMDFALIDGPIGRVKLADSCSLSIFEHTLVAAIVRESHLSEAMVGSLIKAALKDYAICVRLFTFAMRYSLMPGALEDHAPALSQLALAMTLSLEKLAFVDVPGGRDFSTLALRHASLPFAIVCLA